MSPSKEECFHEAWKIIDRWRQTQLVDEAARENLDPVPPAPARLVFDQLAHASALLRRAEGALGEAEERLNEFLPGEPTTAAYRSLRHAQGRMQDLRREWQTRCGT